MKLSFDEIKRIFGSEEKSINEIKLLLTIAYPSFTIADVFSLFKTTLDNYGNRNDEILDTMTWLRARYFDNISSNHIAPAVDHKRNLHSTYVFKNLFKLIDESNEFVLSDGCKSVLFLKFKEERNRLNAALRRDKVNSLDHDCFKIVCEFIDLLERKIENGKFQIA